MKKETAFPFLNTSIRLSNKTFSTTTYRKPLTSHIPVHMSSYHPWLKIAAVKTVFYQDFNFCSSPELLKILIVRLLLLIRIILSKLLTFIMCKFIEFLSSKNVSPIADFSSSITFLFSPVMVSKMLIFKKSFNFLILYLLSINLNVPPIYDASVFLFTEYLVSVVSLIWGKMKVFLRWGIY